MSAVEIGRAVAQLPLLLLHPVAVAVLLAILPLALLLLAEVLARLVEALLVADLLVDLLLVQQGCRTRERGVSASCEAGR